MDGGSLPANSDSNFLFFCPPPPSLHQGTHGVDTDTTEEGIVNDLREGNILIEEKDVIKKSRTGLALNFFRINGKAEDLQNWKKEGP